MDIIKILYGNGGNGRSYDDYHRMLSPCKLCAKNDSVIFIKFIEINV